MPVETAPRPARGIAQTFDFRRPSRLRREHQRVLRMVAETFGRGASTVLSTTLRAQCTVSLTSLDQVGYDEWVRLTPPSFLAVLSLSPLPGSSVLSIPNDLAMSSIDRLLGGTGAGPHPDRPLTDIEVRLLRELVGRMTPELAAGFLPIGRVQPRITRHETDTQFVKAAAPSEMVVLAVFALKVDDQAHEVTLTFPLSSIQRELDAFTEGTLLQEQEVDPDGDVVASLLDAPVDARVRFVDVVLTSAEIIGLRVGDVVPLGHPVRGPLTLMVDGVPCFLVTAGRRNQRLACQVVADEVPSSDDTRHSGGRT